MVKKQRAYSWRFANKDQDATAVFYRSALTGKRRPAERTGTLDSQEKISTKKQLWGVNRFTPQGRVFRELVVAANPRSKLPWARRGLRGERAFSRSSGLGGRTVTKLS